MPGKQAVLMPCPFIFAKKLILPSRSAHVLQSLAMADAFAASGVDLRFFPGIAKNKANPEEDILGTVLDSLGLDRHRSSSWTLLPGSNKGFYGLAFRMAVGKALLAKQKGVFYARDISEASFLAMACAVPGLRRRLFYEMHEVLFRQHEQANAPRREWEQTRRREKAVLNAAAGLVAIHPEIAEAARELLGYTGPVLVEPSAYTPGLFYPLDLFTPENPWPGPEGTVRLVYAGRFHPGKGVDVLIDALRFLPERFCLHIIGGTPSRTFAALRGQAQRVPAGGRRITFAGEVPQRDVRAGCAGAHIAVIPQQMNGGFFSPLKLYEALALGLPVLVTPLHNFGPQQDIVFTAPGLSAQALAAGIATLAADESLARTLRAKGLRAAANATWAARARRITEWIATV